MDQSIKTTPTDVVRSVKALQVAVDSLGMIAGFGGVQGDWAVDALREIEHLVVADKPPRLAAVPDTVADRREQIADLRRAGVADSQGRRSWPLGRESAFDAALGEGRR